MAAAEVPLSCPGCNLVLISIDTCRADRVSFNGHHRKTTKFLDSLVDEGGIVFKRAFSTAPKTAESHMTMFTGVHQNAHGVATPGSHRTWQRTLSPSIPTLPELLQEKRYKTAAFHAGGNISGSYGFARGFEIYQKDLWVEPPLGPKNVLSWIREFSNEKFFLFLHTYNPHDPYMISPPYNTLYNPGYKGKIVSDRRIAIEWDNECRLIKDCWTYRRRQHRYWSRVNLKDPADLHHIKAIYDGALNEADDRLREIFKSLKNVMKRSVVIVLSDHGEEFLEHGGTKHNTVYNEVLHVPFFIKTPALKKKIVIEEPVSLIDLAPTIADILKIQSPDHYQGKSLRDIINGRKRAGGSRIFAEHPKRSRRALQWDGFKMIALMNDSDSIPRPDTHAPEPGVIDAELYDLRADPGEQKSLTKDHPMYQVMLKETRRLYVESGELYKQLTDEAKGQEIEMSEDLINDLGALGYLG